VCKRHCKSTTVRISIEEITSRKDQARSAKKLAGQERQECAEVQDLYATGNCIEPAPDTTGLCSTPVLNVPGIFLRLNWPLSIKGNRVPENVPPNDQVKRIRANFTERIFGGRTSHNTLPGADFSREKTKMDFVRDLKMSGTDTRDYAPNLNMVGTATLEQLSSTLANQTNDQDRYALAETIIAVQVTQRDKLLAEQELLLAEQRAMVEEIRDLKAQIALSRMDTAPAKSLGPSKFILQIPDIKENNKQHLDFGKVKVLSNRSSLEYKGRIFKPQERADLTDKIVESREKYPVRNYADMRKTMDSLQQKFLTNSLYACSHILTSEDEGMELYTTWNNGWEKLSETDKDAQDAKLQSSSILEEIYS
jgi:hypothetical protein